MTTPEIDGDLLAVFAGYRQEAIALAEAIRVTVARHPELPAWFVEEALGGWAAVDEAAIRMTCVRCCQAIPDRHLGLEGPRCAGCAEKEAA